VKPCAPEVIEGMRKLGYFPPNLFGDFQRLWITDGEPDSDDAVPAPPEGPITMTAYGDLTGFHEDFRFPRLSRLHGYAWRGKDRLYAWITEVETPDGKRYPFCANLVTTAHRDELGHLYARSSTPEKLMVWPFVNVAMSRNLGKLK
jgi:hypothetical protein